MTIASHAFLLLFVPITVGLYYAFFRNARQKMFFLLFVSYLFYGLANWEFVPFLLGLSFITFWFARRGWITPGVILNLASLGVFKYWNFGVDTFNSLMDKLGVGMLAPILQIGLPLGISFFVFKHIGYLLDVRQKRYEASSDFWAFATFSAYFPQISAGPISGFNDMAEQFKQLPSKLESRQTYEALVYLSLGLAKKILIADTLGALMSSPINKIGGFDGLLPAWFIVFAYAAQLYFDFSGYTDLVIGVSKLLGINLPQNFNSPYLAKNPAEFWERWHISLSYWFRFYLFFPLSRSFLRSWGSSKRELAQYAANIITMTLVGLWHGAGWGFILWGTYHGILLNLNAWWKRKPQNISVPGWITRPLFLLSVLLGWVLFMSPSVAYLKHLSMQLIGLGGLGKIALLKNLFLNQATPVLLIAIPIAFSGYAEAANLFPRVSAPRARWAAAGLGILAVLSLWMLKTNIPFLYAQF